MDLESKAKIQRQGIQGDINALDQKRRDLQLQLDVLNRLLGEEVKITKLVRTRSAPVSGENLFAKAEGNVETSARKFCVKILDEDPNRYFTAMEMTDELLRRGYKTNAKKFKNSVKSTLNWLRDEGKIKYKAGKGIGHYTSLNNPEN